MLRRLLPIKLAFNGLTRPWLNIKSVFACTVVAISAVELTAQALLVSGYNFGQFIGVGDGAIDPGTFADEGKIFANWTEVGSGVGGPPIDSPGQLGNYSPAFSNGTGTIYWDGTAGSTNQVGHRGVVSHDNPSFSVNSTTLGGKNMALLGDWSAANMALDVKGNHSIGFVQNMTGIFEAGANDLTFAAQAVADPITITWIYGGAQVAMTQIGTNWAAYTVDLPASFYGSISNLTATFSGAGRLDNVQFNGRTTQGGENPPPSADTVYWMGGGGTWSAASTATDWRAATGSDPLAWNSKVAAFRTVQNATPGTVAIADAGVTVTGLTFEVSGYTLSGGDITTTTASTPIQVGTGASAATTTATINAKITGAGGIAKTGAGTLTLGGDNSYTGATAVNAGTLRVDGDQSAATGAVTVASGGRLTGSGTLGGAVTIQAGGRLVAPSVLSETFTLASLVLTPTSLLDISLGAPGNTVARFTIGGNLTLDGTLTVTPGTGFAAGTYTLFDFSGTLQNNDLTLAGISGYTGTIAAQSGKVTLTLVVGNTGGGPPPSGGQGVWKGGTGSWSSSASSKNWRSDNGNVSGPWSGESATFRGTAGTVTVNTAAGAVRFEELNFTTTGYAVTGDDLTISGGGTITTAANVTATVGSRIVGSGGLDKAGAGTLILTANNTYTGGTSIEAGTLQLGNGGTTGSIAGDVANSGVLRFNRSDELTVSGVISGSGSVVQQGTGTTILSGKNTYTGATTINAGTLLLNGDQAAATGAITVNSGGSLGGSGQTGGAVTVANGGALRLASGSRLTTGAVTLANTSHLNVTLAAPGANQLLQVNGDLVLDGILHLGSATGSTLSAGAYRIIDYTGNMTNSTLTLGNLAVNPGDVSIQTSAANPVNVVIAATVSNYWKGGAGGWTTGDSSWVNLTGGAAGAWTNGVATFGGTAGKVTVAGGGVTASGLQFLTSGYEVDGGTITTTTAQTRMQVGNATASGASTTASISATLGGTGGIEKTDLGTLTLSGANTYTGTTTVSGGTLLVNGDQSAASGNVAVARGATLGGTGTLGGNVAIAGGGTLRGRSGSTLTMGGLVLDQDARVFVNLGAPTATALFQVNGALTLDGRLDIESGTGYGAGLYRLFNYTGTLNNQTLEIGSTPTSGLLNAIQTSVANQVNVVVEVGELPIWAGGSGTWSSTGGASNWGAVNGGYTDTWQGGMAIFQGTAGTVQVESSAANPLTFTGLQFADTNFVVQGGDLTLNDANTLIRVGDGTEDGTAMVGTIRSALIGSGGLDKSDLGTLVLTGANTYSGGTTISDGTLQIGDGGTRGSIVGDVQNDGVFAVNRGDTVTFHGRLSGTGAFEQRGAGATVLTASNNYSGGTVIAAGTLQLGAGGATGSIAGDVENDGELIIDRNNTLTLGGDISGAGSLRQVGSGKTILTGAATHSGGTIVQAGTLQIGAGGTTGSLTGPIENHATLGINRSNAVELTAPITGRGQLVQQGTGTTTLTATHTYTGGTVVQAGTLQLGSGGAAGSVSGPILNHGVLAVNRTGEVTLDNPISGFGSLEYRAAGTLTLTGSNLYSGGTTVKNGGTVVVLQDAALGATMGGVTLDAGTLRAGADLSTARTITLAQNGGTLDTGRYTLTTQGNLTGAGALNKTGAGTWVVRGSSSATGLTTIAQGTAHLDGGTLSVTNVGADGRLTGNGTVQGNLTNSGLVSPGNSAGEIRIVGDYTQAATGVLAMELGSATSFDKLDVTGNVVLGGALNITALNGYTPEPGDTFQVIKAGGTISSTFSTVNSPWSAASPMLRFEAVYQPKNVTLSMTQLPFAQIEDSTPNQAAFGQGVDTAIGQGTIKALQRALNALPNLSAVRSAVDQLSPLRYDRWFAQSVYTADSTVRSIEGRMAQVTPGPRGALWSDVVRREATFDATSELAEAKASTNGILVGGDVRATENLQVGLVFGYTDESLNLDDRGSSTEIKRLSGSVYGRYDISPLFVEAVAGAAIGQLESRRTIVIPGYNRTAESETDSRDLFSSLRVGYNLSAGRVRLTPYAAANYVRWSVDAVNESGADDANLHLNEQSRTSFSSRAGLTLAYPIMGESISFIPRLDVAWRREFKGEQELLSGDIGGGAFAFHPPASEADGEGESIGSVVGGDDATDPRPRRKKNGLIASAGIDVVFGSRLTTYLRVATENSTAADKAVDARFGAELRF